MLVVIKIGTPKKKKKLGATYEGFKHVERERETASGIGHAEPSPALYACVMLDDRVSEKYSDAV